MGGRAAPRFARRERGVILIDYFIGVTFFMVTFGAFVDMTTAKTRATSEAERRFAAVNAAESRLAVAHAGASGAGAFEVAAPLGAHGELFYKARADGLREATVVVRWRETHGEEESVRLTTVLGGAP